MAGKLSIGLDIGTTTISAVVLDIENGTVLRVQNIPGKADIPAQNPWEHRQAPAVLREKVTALLNDLIDTCGGICSIGVTGQMHGILYTTAAGEALSPLYTWQDGLAGIGSPSACDMIREKTGYRTAAGYGLATHYALSLLGETPVGAYLCTIMDWIVMGLCGLQKPVIHSTNAASLGLYRLAEDRFDEEALRTLGIEAAILPTVTNRCEAVGSYRGIPVSAAIGDNQAAFLGSVRAPEDTVLVNIGTGSQISLLCGRNTPLAEGAVETRPFSETERLLSGSGLCGGRAYALLETFFRKYARAAGMPDTEHYPVMNLLAAQGLRNGKVLPVRTTFCGTREDPSLLGQITDIGEDDLTPEGLCAGVLQGMAEELYRMYLTMPHDHITAITASGNAVRKNPVLQQILENTFGMPLQIPEHKEEAAFGAAMFGARAAGKRDLQHCIRYQTNIK
ncbi:MAG: hypothetical protein IKV57_02735 [Clostridia bacterium]|nr:hypothetical protein [Clostridia bacterium]